MRSAQPGEYVARLDHLRFYAAVLVLLFHFFHRYVGDMRANNALLSLVDEGHTGVGLFMVMSGFIFTLLAREREVVYWAFLRNRLIRIYPLFVFAVLLSLFIGTYNEHRNYGFDALVGWLMPFVLLAAGGLWMHRWIRRAAHAGVTNLSLIHIFHHAYTAR